MVAILKQRLLPEDITYRNCFQVVCCDSQAVRFIAHAATVVFKVTHMQIFGVLEICLAGLFGVHPSQGWIAPTKETLDVGGQIPNHK